MNDYKQKATALRSFYDLYQHLGNFGDHTAFVEGERNVSYREFLRDIDSLSQSFACKERYVLLKLSSKYLFAVSFFAVVLSGNIACLQPPDAAYQDFFSGFDLAYSLTDELVVEQLKEKATALWYARPGRLSLVLCTSGTTSEPKAVGLSEENVITDLVAGVSRYGYCPDDSFVSIIPYTHIYGLVCDLCAPLSGGSTLCLASSLPDFLRLLPQVSPTGLHVTPGIVSLLLQRLQASGEQTKVVGTKLKRIMSGGAGTSASVCEQMEPYGISVYGCYGMTECACGISLCSEQWNRKGSAGPILDCNTVCFDEDGRITVSGSNVMQGYIDRQGNLESLQGNGFVTGDIGYLDPDGYLFITGRADDLLVFADGTKLAPLRIEQQLNDLPGVAESLVYQLDAHRMGAILCLHPHAGELEVVAAAQKICCDGRKLSSIQISDAPLIKTPSGKLCRGNYGK